MNFSQDNHHFKYWKSLMHFKETCMQVKKQQLEWDMEQQTGSKLGKEYSTLNIHWNDWCWSWSSNTLATWCKELTLCWEWLKAGGEGDNRGRDGWISDSRDMRNSGRWSRTGKSGMLQSMGHKESDMTEWLNNKRAL